MATAQQYSEEVNQFAISAVLVFMLTVKITPYTEIIRIHLLILLYLSLTWFLKFSRSFSSSFKTWRIKASPNWSSFRPFILRFVILPPSVITACPRRSARDQGRCICGRRRLVYSKYPGHQKRRRSVPSTRSFSKNFLRIWCKFHTCTNPNR